MLEVLRRFVKFVAVSFIGGGIDLFMVWILTGYVFNTYFTDVIIAPLISFECAVVVGFTFCWFLIWNDRVGGGVAEFFRRMGMYNVSNLGVFCIRLLLVLVFQRFMPHHLVLCNLFARMLAGIVNFVVIDKLIFRKTRTI